MTPEQIIEKIFEYLKYSSEMLASDCDPCHDYAEINKLSTLEQIRLSYEEAEIKEAKEKKFTDRQESFPRPDWHAWVYGGMRRPDISSGIVHLQKLDCEIEFEL